MHRSDAKALSSVQNVTSTVHDDPVARLLIGQSPSIQNIIAVARQIALHPTTTVLIQGDSGTGKDVVARMIHLLNGLAPSQFIAINCAAIPETLLETELFGVEEGAFTDAKTSRDGYVARANGGTLFLDEIGAMPLVLQAKLLRFLETLSFRRVGGTKELHVRLRVISATNVDLQAAVAQKAFRDDLFYRLKVMTIYIPPLRERREDIELLVGHFLEEESARRNAHFTMSPEAMDVLRRYSWPGNIRQLRSTIELGCILCNSGMIVPANFPDILHDLHNDQVRDQPNIYALLEQLVLPAEGVQLPELLGHIECLFLHQALERCRGNQVRAAALLGISRDQLRYRLLEKSGRSDDQARV